MVYVARPPATQSDTRVHHCDPIQVVYQDAYVAVIQTNAGMTLTSLQANGADIADINNVTNQAQATYGGFNLGLHVEDNPAQVLANRALLLKRLNQWGKVKCIHWLSQVHGNTVIQTEQQPLSMQPSQADALLSTQAHQALAIMTADCVPICVWQQNTHKIAAIHAGWQGLANGVIAHTLSGFDINKGAIHAVIGACISQSNYEVSLVVVDQLAAALDTDIQAFVRPHQTDEQKAWLDLPRIASAQLQQAGVNKQHINQQTTAPLSATSAWACSYDDGRYYSYRRMSHRSEPQTGRMAMVIVRL